jgi:hypothetical protein
MTDPKTSPQEPKCELLLMCVECGVGVPALLPLDQIAIERLLAQHGWYTSVLTPPNSDPKVPIVIGPLCNRCAARVFPPGILATAEQRRQKILADLGKATP